MAEMISKQHLLEQIDTTGKGCEYEGKEFLAYQEAMLAVVELIEKEPAVEKEYDVMFSGTEHIDSPGPAPVVGYRIAAKSWEEAVQKGKFYAEMQHPAFIPFAFAGPVIEVPKEELENLETEKKIMDAVRKDVRRLVNKELEAANKRFPQFASPHEGQNVVREELEEAERAIVPLKLYIETRMWNMVKANQTVPKDDFKAIREAAVNLAVEAIQVAAMAKKFEHGQRNNWPGAREDSHGEEKNRAGSGNSDNHHEPTGGGSGKDRL